jgi:hypothetical protein
MFEHEHALRDLNKRTPEYLRGELFAHGDLTMIRDAKRILAEGIDPTGATKELCGWLSVTGEIS